MCVLGTGDDTAKTDSAGPSETELMPGSVPGGGDPEIKNEDMLVKKPTSNGGESQVYVQSSTVPPSQCVQVKHRRGK